MIASLKLQNVKEYPRTIDGWHRLLLLVKWQTKYRLIMKNNFWVIWPMWTCKVSALQTNKQSSKNFTYLQCTYHIARRIHYKILQLISLLFRPLNVDCKWIDLWLFPWSSTPWLIGSVQMNAKLLIKETPSFPWRWNDCGKWMSNIAKSNVATGGISVPRGIVMFVFSPNYLKLEWT